MRLVNGEFQVACEILDGAFQMLPDSGEVVSTPGPMPGPEAVQPSPGLRHWSLSGVNDDALQFLV